MTRRRLAALFVVLFLIFGLFGIGAMAAHKCFPVGHPQYDPTKCDPPPTTTTTVAPTTTLAPTTTTIAPTTTTTAVPPTTTTTAAPTTTTAAPTTTTIAPTTTTTAAPTTTTLPATTTTTPPTGCSGIQVAAGANLVTVANANAAGTTFCLAAGQYNLTGGIPLQSGDKWIGALGPQGQRLTILDGGDTATSALSCTCTNGEIRNIIIEDFTGDRLAPMGPALNGWLFDNIESRENAGYGFSSNDNATLRNSYIHHNHRHGLVGQGDNVVIDNVEVAFNNYLGLNDPGFEAGGSKWVNTDSLTVRNSNFHDNCGPGMWTDSNNSNVRYENNVAFRNAGSGLRHEISGSATIIGNRFENNAHGTLGAGGPTCRAGYSGSIGGVNIARSGPNIEVANNIFIGNDGGFVAQSDTTSRVDNLNVHDNTITYSQGWSGFNSAGDTAVSGISFENNDYDVPTPSGSWWNYDGLKTWTQWQALGYDDTGSVS